MTFSRTRHTRGTCAHMQTKHLKGITLGKMLEYELVLATFLIAIKMNTCKSPLEKGILLIHNLRIQSIMVGIDFMWLSYPSPIKTVKEGPENIPLVKPSAKVIDKRSTSIAGQLVLSVLHSLGDKMVEIVYRMSKRMLGNFSSWSGEHETSTLSL